ncbi:hypothetical protein ACIRP2_35785 [Streptomyces sp. NPDC101194]|uniref:hypothetical protein n=1 Tax=Streptomyces sp. NPDC101194 TaxID=3366127 RepID=UPI00382CAA45
MTHARSEGLSDSGPAARLSRPEPVDGSGPERPVVLPALLFAASGVAAVTRGWVLPTNRRTARRPRVYGWGQSTAAFALCWQMVFLLVLNDPGTRRWKTPSGSALPLIGLVPMAVSTVSHRAGGGRPGRGTH